MDIRKLKYTKRWSIARSRLVFYLKILFRFLFKHRGNVLYSQGVHIITSPSGSGKTLTSNIIIRNMTRNSNNFFWVNVDQYDKNLHLYGGSKKTACFNMHKLFRDGKQIYKLNKYITKKKDDNEYKIYSLGIICDEINLQFNRRQNRTKDYNDIFMPFISLAVSHRHNDQDRLYLLGQSYFMQDTQIMQICKYKHTVFCSKKYNYYYFREQNKLIKAPKYLKIITDFNKGLNDSGFVVWRQIHKQKIKITQEYLDTYDQHGFADYIKDLPNYREN